MHGFTEKFVLQNLSLYIYIFWNHIITSVPKKDSTRIRLISIQDSKILEH